MSDDIVTSSGYIQSSCVDSEDHFRTFFFTDVQHVFPPPTLIKAHIHSTSRYCSCFFLIASGSRGHGLIPIARDQVYYTTNLEHDMLLSYIEEEKYNVDDEKHIYYLYLMSVFTFLYMKIYKYDNVYTVN